MRNSETSPLLSLTGVSSGYGTIGVLKEVSLDVFPGETLALIGKNGMGKSTLLKTIVGNIKCESGSITFDGQRVDRFRPYQIARKGIALAGQERSLFAELSVEENVAIALPKNVSIKGAFEYIETLFPNLAVRRRQIAGTLSGGEQKMLLLARALASKPKMMLVDEITEGVQPSVREVLRRALIAESRERGTTVILVEQDLAFAFSLAHRYSVVKLGGVSPPEDVSGKLWVDAAKDHLSV